MSAGDERVRVEDALAISERWLHELDLGRLTATRLADLGLAQDVDVDVVAIGKVSREMSSAVDAVLGERVRRRLIVCDASAARDVRASEVVVGEHPIPGDGSWRAGQRLISFLDDWTTVDCTLFLVSGGASSLCVVPVPPLSLEDLRGVWDAALERGIDITALNQLRAATSAIAGGGVLRHVTTATSRSLILVDNVISGAEWVASGLTYDYAPTSDEVAGLVEHVGLVNAELGARLLRAFNRRERLMVVAPTSLHENTVLAQPSMLLDAAVGEANRLGYRVVNMGSRVHGDLPDVVTHWAKVMEGEARTVSRTAFVGVGEVTVRVRGHGAGGRCQEFAWLMADVLDRFNRPGAFVARASDGRDYVEGVGGAWVEGSTKSRLIEVGIDWLDVARRHDTFPALRTLGQLIEGGHSGWNLCDLYVTTW
jgi:glycerate 2-kinase